LATSTGGNWCWKGSISMLTDFDTKGTIILSCFHLKISNFLPWYDTKKAKIWLVCKWAIFVRPQNDNSTAIGSICRPKFGL
jgi:hypothetical protein